MYLPSAEPAGSRAIEVFSARVITPPVVNADGVVSVGEVKVLFVRVWLVLTSTRVIPSTEISPAETLAKVVSEAAPNSTVPKVNAVEVPTSKVFIPAKTNHPIVL